MYNFEENKNNKGAPVENNSVQEHNEHNVIKTDNAFEKKGFVAWPEEKSQVNVSDVEVIEGRTKKGGYVALPKE